MAPLIIFAFNRPKEFKRLIDSLVDNPESLESELYIYIDGARPHKDGELEKVNDVIKTAKTIDGFAKINIRISNCNNGLALSIISGVSDVIERHGSAIVLEDDLIVQPNFLKFMNEGLKKYENNKDVWSICGYTKIKIDANCNEDAYFCTRSSSWGWATWKDRWISVDWSFDNWNEWKTKRFAFNKWGGSDCFSMLESCKKGTNQSWAIRFCFNQFLQNKKSLFPKKSLIYNDGFDGNGTHCKKYSRYRFNLMEENKVEFNFPSICKIDKRIHNKAIRYNWRIFRIWTRFINFFYN